MLSMKGYEIETVESVDEALKALVDSDFDLMITDLKLGKGADGLDLLQEVRSRHRHVTAIMITAYGTVDVAVQAMKAGAFDFVTKPFKMDSLLKTVQNAFHHREIRKGCAELNGKEITLYFDRLVGDSEEMKKVYSLVKRVSRTDATVLIHGESGTGKELIAEALHRTSSRVNGPFIPLNCAALSPTLLESELFGHVAGAFTGATSSRDGLFIAADKGTIFLDEIESMDLGIQSKLLRVLQEKKVRRVGDTQLRPVDVRVLAATNESLEDKRDRGEFREDLYYRISVIPINLPPLRWRQEDIPLLVNYFCKMQANDLKQEIVCNPEVLDALQAYSWPSNVRELQNAIACAAALSEDGKIQLADLPPNIRGDMINAHAPQKSQQAVLLEPDASSVENVESLRDYLQYKEREYIEQVLNKTRGDILKAAELLGISRATIYRKMPAAS